MTVITREEPRADRVARRGEGDPHPIAGVRTVPLAPNVDFRGSVCEIHRDSWGVAPHPVQWDFVVTRANVLRGVHVHRLRYDYMLVIKGRATFGLSDLRPGSPSFRRSMTYEASGDAPSLVLVPPGVAHGIYAHDDVFYLYGLTAYWNGNDEIGCRFDDPAMNIGWPAENPTLLPRDAELPSFETLLRKFLDAGGVAPNL